VPVAPTSPLNRVRRSARVPPPTCLDPSICQYIGILRYVNTQKEGVNFTLWRRGFLIVDGAKTTRAQSTCALTSRAQIIGVHISLGPERPVGQRCRPRCTMGDEPTQCGRTLRRPIPVREEPTQCGRTLRRPIPVREEPTQCGRTLRRPIPVREEPTGGAFGHTDDDRPREARRSEAEGRADTLTLHNAWFTMTRPRL
jgi:hypothetical protein